MKKEFPDLKPEDIFDRKFFDSYQIGSNPIYQQHLEEIRNIAPTEGHYFCTRLYEKGWLRRVYTQNIDGLHQKAGLPEEMVVEFHGSIFKNNVILYSDSIDKKSIEIAVDDFVLSDPVDLILVMGTSLQVAPFCAIPNFVPSTCVRVLIDLCPHRAFRNAWTPEKRNYDHGLYSYSGCMSRSYATFSKRKDGTSGGMIKRKVSLRPQWSHRSKYRKQFIITSDIDACVARIQKYLIP